MKCDGLFLKDLYELLEKGLFQKEKWASTRFEAWQEEFFRASLVDVSGVNVKEVFCKKTYVSFLAKATALFLLAFLRFEAPSYCRKALADVKALCESLEDGEAHSLLGVANFTKPNYFDWYVNLRWPKTFLENATLLLKKAAHFATTCLEESNPLDFWQSFYENFLPKKVRRFFGSYYTPFYVANYVVRDVERELPPDYSAVDPTCGVGAFVVSALRSKLEKGLRDLEVLRKKVVGLDVDPVAVLLARLNYVFTLASFFRKDLSLTNFEVPIYVRNVLEKHLSDGKSERNLEVNSTFDLVVGNPPWIRWSELRKDVRGKLKSVLREKGLFSGDRNVGGVDLNVCAIVVVEAVESFAKSGSLVVFVLPRGTLTNKSFEGFRRWTWGSKKVTPVRLYVPVREVFKEEESIVFAWRVA